MFYAVVSMSGPNNIPVAMGIYPDMATAVLSVKKTGTVMFTKESSSYCEGLVSIPQLADKFGYLACDFSIVMCKMSTEVNSLFRE